jgi:RHS repeat-associated protein
MWNTTLFSAAQQIPRLQRHGGARVPGPYFGSPKTADPRPNTVVSGRRYYSPGQGRFLGRDPKEEKGGLNVYGFTRNNPINLWDVLGMEPDFRPRNTTEVVVELEIDGGVLYEVSYTGFSTSPGSEWDELEWQEVGRRALGGGRGVPEDDFIMPPIGVGIVVAGGIPNGKPPPVFTHSITFYVGFDSSVVDVEAATAAVNSNISTMQQLFNANGLGHVRTQVVWASVSPNAPDGSYVFDPRRDRNMTDGRNAMTEMVGNPGIQMPPGAIPVVVTDRNLLSSGAGSLRAVAGVAPHGGIPGFFVNSAHLGGTGNLFIHEAGHVAGYFGADGRHATDPRNVMHDKATNQQTIIDDSYKIAILRIATPIP